LIGDLTKRPEFVAMTRGNAMQAKKLRTQYSTAVNALLK
jgi:hypothetical protein